MYRALAEPLIPPRDGPGGHPLSITLTIVGRADLFLLLRLSVAGIKQCIDLKIN